jgi:hypothetical protein
MQGSSTPTRNTHHFVFLANLPFFTWCYLIYKLFFAPYHIVVWLQNSDEIRATGGFLGSLAWVETRGVIPREMQLIDIYDIGGHLRDYIPAPPPVAQFLAGGGSWRLQDVNWDRDFAVSAARFSEFLALAGQPRPNLIIAVNLDLVEKFFDELGGVTVSDAQGNTTVLTSENFAFTARARRPRIGRHDFPKMDLLRAATTAVQEEIIVLPRYRQRELLDWIVVQVRAGQVQFYSPHALLQRFFARQKIAGLLTDSPEVHNVYLIDSNVGINKVNRYVTRTHFLTHHEASPAASLQLTWYNSCQPDFTVGLTEADCTYANYFRVMLDQHTIPLFPLDTLDVNTITDSRGQTWQEIGWLIMIPPNSTASATLDFASIYNTWEIR